MMRFNRRPFLLAIISTFALAQISFAQENEKETRDKKFNLGQVVVTATKTERAIGDVPASVTVITSEEITRSGAKCIDDVFRTTVGIDISGSPGPITPHRQVNPRGTGHYPQARTLVLIDGIPANDMYSGFVNWNYLPLDTIEKIEIVRGPGSCLYGSNAMGGVINIITKRPQKKCETSVTSSYGSMNTYSLNISQGGSHKVFDYYLFGGLFETDGYKVVPKDDRKSYDIERSINSKNIGGKFIWKIDEISTLGLDVSHYEDDLNRGRPLYYLYKDQERYGISYQRKEEKYNLSGTLYLNETDYHSVQDKSPNYDLIDYTTVSSKRDWGTMIQASVPLGGKHTMTFGGDYRWGKANSKDDYQTVTRIKEMKGKQELYSVFLQDEFKLTDKFILTGGGRLDWFKNYDGYSYDDNLSPKATNYSEKSDHSFNPKIGAVYHFTNSSTLRGSVGKAFRAPTLYDLYRAYKSGSWTYQGNPDLGPEEMVSYEIGWDQRFGENMSTKISVYQNDADDFIYSVTTDSVNKIRMKKNVGKVRMRGIELETKYNINTKWSCFANYTYNQSEINKFSEDSTLEGKELQYMPHHKCNLGVTFDEPKLFRVDLIGRHKGGRFADDGNDDKMKSYFVIDLRLNRKFSENFEALLDISNLTDKIYREYHKNIAPPLAVTGTIKVKF